VKGAGVRKGIAAVLVMVGALGAHAQAPTRVATTADVLIAAPVFFHGKQIVVRSGVVDSGGVTQLANTRKPVFVLWREPTTPRSDAEIRGEFWDIGRLQPDDSRFSTVDFKSLLQAATGGQWPSRDQVFMLLGATSVESPLPAEPSIRSLALAPDRYQDRAVTVTGRFRGANLYGDLPQPVNKSRWDFVVQSADAAVWVTGMRPRGKGFNLDPMARADTGQWLQVTGTLRHEGALTWIEAGGLVTASAPAETAIDVVIPSTPREVPPQVVFTAPIEGDNSADRATPVRIQFSRDMDMRSFRDHIRVSYSGTVPEGAPAQPPAFTFRYLDAPRALEIRFAEPLDRFRNVKVELSEGIMSAVDNQPLAPWSFSFTTGS
jgi:Big-like domain-containing protein